MHIYNTPDNITAFATTRDGDVSVSIGRLFLPYHQVHGTNTLIIDEAFMEKNALEQALALHGIDALSTNLRGVCLAVKTADCIPVLMWDEKENVVSAVHAGWKGTMQRIVEANIDVLQSTYGTQSCNLHAIIGPGIGPDSFEVGDEVFDAFANAGFQMERLASRHPAMNAQAGAFTTKWHIDLWECNRMQLIKKGVNPANIHVAGIDTYQKYEQFFSARRHGDGRIINGIMMN